MNFNKVIDVQCKYFNDFFLQFNNIPFLKVKNEFLLDVRKYCFLEKDKITLEKSYNLITYEISLFLDNFNEVTCSSKRIIIINEKSKIEIDQKKTYLYIVEFVNEILLEIDKIFTIKEFNKFNSIDLKQSTIEAPAKEIEPIVWTGDNVLLGYLVQWLKDNNYVSKKTSRDTVIKNHFVDENGKPIVNIKQGLQNMRDINNGGLPKDYEKIEPLLKILTDLKDIFK